MRKTDRIVYCGTVREKSFYEVNKVIVRPRLRTATIQPLDPRNDIHNHSPSGFAWGYGGSGPAQLALALAADRLNDDKRALRVYHILKRLIIQHIPMDSDWKASATRVLYWIVAAEAILDAEAAEVSQAVMALLPGKGARQ